VAVLRSNSAPLSEQYWARKNDYQPQANDLKPDCEGYPTSGEKLLISA